jgi:hypothetical protein
MVEVGPSCGGNEAPKRSGSEGFPGLLIVRDLRVLATAPDPTA